MAEFDRLPWQHKGYSCPKRVNSHKGIQLELDKQVYNINFYINCINYSFDLSAFVAMES